jgi:PKD repeat protein
LYPGKRRSSASSPLDLFVPAILVMMFLATPLLAMADVGSETGIALVDKATAYDRAKLAGADVTVLEDYGAFAMVEAPRDVLSRMTVRRHLDDRTVIGLAGYSFDTRDGLPDLPADLRQSPPEEGIGYFLVQFKGPIKTEWRQMLLSMGAEPQVYYPNFAYVVRMDVRAIEDLRAMPFVTWAGHYQPAFKISPVVEGWSGILRLDIALHQEEAAGPVVDALIDMGAFVVLVSADQVNPTIEALVDDVDVPKVARMNAVWWLEVHYTGGEPPNDPAQWILQSNVEDYYPLYDNGLHGENMVIGNADTGIHVAHLAFHDATRAVQYTDPASNTPPDTQHRKIVNYWTFGDNTDEYAGGHGTRTAGTNAGNNIPNNGNPQYRGIAFEAKLSFQDVWNDQTWQDARPPDKGDMYDKTYRDGGWIHSGSLVCFAGGEYNTEAMELDQFLWAHQDFLGVIANHNYGSGDVPNSVCDLASAKGTMSIGAVVNHPDQEDLHDYTGRGPTDDGRLKPTLSSVTDVNAPADNTQNGFEDIGGTSGATPAGAGAMVLARQYFYDGFYPEGVKNDSNGFNASGALMKAIGINGAQEMTGDNANEVPYNSMDYPSNTQGWGRLNLDEALYFAGDMRALYVDDNRTGLSTGQESHHEVDIVGTDMPIEVTLVWTDYWGAPLAPKELVNDLDLTVTAPDGTTIYKGNVLGGAAYPHESQTGGSYDDVNVEENVLKFDPQLGTWKVNVTAVNTPQGPQPFAVVVTGNTSKPDDLVIKPANMRFAVDEPDEGDNVTINVTIRNLGGNPFAGIDALIRLDGAVLETRSVPIPWGGYAHFSIEAGIGWGTHTISVELDPDHVIAETIEDNNFAERSIYVNKRPTAAFVATPLEIFTFENVTINASTSVDDGNVTKFMFDWGDGKKSNWQASPEAIHEYKADGLYNISVKVMDNRSVESDWAPNITVLVKNRAPWANATASTLEAYTFFNISFDGTGSGDTDGLLIYEWDLGDGNTTNKTTFQHMYEDDGDYNIALTVTDDDGAEDLTTFVIRILNRRPTAKFLASGDFGNATTNFTFIPKVDDMDGEVAVFKWDFGDGNTTTEEAPVHRYGDDGIYNVTFQVLDDDGAGSDIVFWHIEIVNLAPRAAISVNTTEALTYDSFGFRSTSLDLDGKVVNCTWNMGDGTFYSTKDVEHFYRDDGTYRISLKIEDDDGAQAEANLTVRVLNRAPSLSVQYNDTIIEGVAVNFTASGSWDKDGNIISYYWDFGNDTVRRGDVVSYTFWSPGVYTVTLTITDNDLAVTYEAFNITVQVKPLPPPPKHPRNGLSTGLVMGLAALLIVVIVLVIIMMLRSKMRARSAGRAAPSGFDPDAAAMVPGPGVESHPGYAPEDSAGSGYEFSGYGDATVYGGPEDQWPATTEEVHQEEAGADMTVQEPAVTVPIEGPAEAPPEAVQDVPKAQAQAVSEGHSGQAEPMRAGAKKVEPKDK